MGINWHSLRHSRTSFAPGSTRSKHHEYERNQTTPERNQQIQSIARRSYRSGCRFKPRDLANHEMRWELPHQKRTCFRTYQSARLAVRPDSTNQRSNTLGLDDTEDRGWLAVRPLVRLSNYWEQAVEKHRLKNRFSISTSNGVSA